MKHQFTVLSIFRLTALAWFGTNQVRFGHHALSDWQIGGTFILNLGITTNLGPKPKLEISTLLGYGLPVSHSWEPEIILNSSSTASGSRRFSTLTCLLTTTFISFSIFSLLETISLKMWERPRPWHVKCPLPVSFCCSKTSLAEAFNVYRSTT